MKPVIFFDMDGVLADFVGGALAAHGRTDIPHAEVTWGIEAQLGIAPADFWSVCDFDFWANLAVLDDGRKLIARAEWIAGAANIALLTSPCDTKGCIDGKRAWIERHLPEYRRRAFFGSAKELFAGPTKVLIDDHDDNCSKFSRAGGYALQPARPWNRLGASCVNGHEFNVETAARLLEAATDLIEYGSKP